MREKPNAAYRSAAEEFARRLTSALGDRVDSIVLYGSVARRQAKRDSDVDILVISQDADYTQEVASQICSDLEYESNYAFLISVVHLGREEFYAERQLGTRFLATVLSQGIALHDNGTFSRGREKALAASR